MWRMSQVDTFSSAGANALLITEWLYVVPEVDSEWELGVG